MSLVKFGNTVDMEALPNPLTSESFLLGYDLDGILKQKDYLGNVTPIGSVISGAQSNFFLSDTGLDSHGNKIASIYRSGNLRIGSTQSYTQMSGSTFSIYTNNGGVPSLYFALDNNSLVINSSHNIIGDKLYWDPSTGLKFNDNLNIFYSVFSSNGLSFSNSNFYSVFSSAGLSFSNSNIGSVIDITAEDITISNGLTSSFISATATGFNQTSNKLTLLPTTLSTNNVQYYQDKSGTFSLVDDVINSSLFYLAGSTNSVIDNKTQSIYRTGNIGIGTASPSTKLHIYATQSGAFRLVDGTQGPGYLLASDTNGVASWTASNYAPDSNVVHRTGNENISGNKTFENIGFFSNVSVRNYNTGPSSTALDSLNGNGGIGIKSQNISSGIGIYSNSTSTGLNYVGANSGVTTFTVNKTGEVYATKIGIGTTGPSTTLHIYATQSGFGFRLQDGSENPNYILTSNAIGMGTWTSPSSLLQEPSQITITTATDITTGTTASNGYGQKGKNVIINNGTNNISITVDGGTDFVSSYVKHGSGVITFVQGSGRTLIQVDATVVLNGATGSTATIASVLTTDYLRISNA